MNARATDNQLGATPESPYLSRRVSRRRPGGEAPPRTQKAARSSQDGTALKFGTPAQSAPAEAGGLSRSRFGANSLNPLQASLFAVLATTATLLLRTALDGQLGGEPTLVMFTLPIMVSAYLGGMGAGLLATALSFGLADFFLLAPLHSFRIEGAAQRLNISFVMLAGVIISALNGAFHRALRQIDVAYREQRGRAALVKTGILQSAIFNSANFSCIATDARGVIQLFNIGAERMLGFAAADVLNKVTPAALSDPAEVIERSDTLSLEFGTLIMPGFEALVFKASRGIEDIYELTTIRKDGSRFPALVSVTALRDVQNLIIGYLLIGTDNTARKRVEVERRQAEEALQQTNVELESARNAAEKSNLAKSDFLSSMSHELRTPLNGIIGFTEFLIDGKPGPLAPKQKEYLHDVLNSGRHLLQLINDVLDLAKVEAGKMELHPEIFLVRKAVGEVVAVIQGIAQKKHITVGIEISAGLETVTIDQHKFKQVLYNLLSNAVKFTDEKGSVEISARCVEARMFAVEVRDTGIGIRSEDMNRLFTEFEQLDSGNARRFEGTGLGLALTKKVIEFQGGSISVESEMGKGSVFTFSLPLISSGTIAA